MKKCKIFLYFVVSFLFMGATLEAVEPACIYLTWVEDPSSSMMVQWQTLNQPKISRLFYRQAQGENTYWNVAEGSTETLKKSFTIHSVHLTGLQENTSYIFKVEGSQKEYLFRTMPKTLSRSVKFAIGGDAYWPDKSTIFLNMNKVISESDPDFVVIMGDLVYNSKTRSMNKQEKIQLLLKETQETLRGKDGRLIPLLIGVGNHDVPALGHLKPGEIDKFYQIFAFPERNKAYRTVNFGTYLSLVLLDSDHTHPIPGEQTTWLEKTLQEGKAFKYTIPVYHISAYPSYYPFDEAIPKKIRNHWVPLFDKFNVKVAFEHHNHCYKRTHPLKNGWKDSSGVIYLGDGSYGVPPRKPWSPDELWYLAKSASASSCFIVSLYEDRWIIEAKDQSGNVIDVILNP